MKTNAHRELKHIAYDINDLNASIGLIQNYISCLQMQAKEVATPEDCLYLVYSLTQEHDFDNISGILDSTSKTIDSVANELLDRSEMAVTVND